MNNFDAILELHINESETISDRRWSRFVDDVCRYMGLLSLDGDQDIDGYSLDYAHDFFRDGLSAEEAAGEFSAMRHEIRNPG
jgi:hypothetical protein